MKDYSNTERQFTRLSRAWYANANMVGWKPGEDEITVGLYDPGEEGGTEGEFEIRWHRLNDDWLAPCIVICDYAWEPTFRYFRDVLMELSDLNGENPTPKEVENVLLNCGVKDVTEEKKKYRGLCNHDNLESVHYGNGVFIRQCPLCEHVGITIQGWIDFPSLMPTVNMVSAQTADSNTGMKEKLEAMDNE